MRNISSPHSRVTRPRAKRLNRTPKPWNKKLDKKQPLSDTRISSQSRNTEDPPMEP